MAGPAAAGYAAIVIDADTGAVLHARNADTRNYPASLTKMMTLFMVFDHLAQGKLRLDQELPVSARAAGMAPSKLGLRKGQTITVEDAILALVTKSANDVAVVVAEALGGSETKFAAMMTRRARELGMRNTTFRNASGLPNAGQVTTARDMATLGRALIREHARYYHYFSASDFEWQGQTISSHNRLLRRYKGADGIKTGYIHASGFNLVASAKRDGRRLIGVVLGGRTAKTRDAQMIKLLDKGFAGLPDRDEPVMAEAEDKLPENGRISVANAGTDEIKGSGDAEEADWGIQVGAFKLRHSAEKAVERTRGQLKSLLSDGRPRIVPATAGKSKVFRARILGLTEDQARAACKKLNAGRGVDQCAVVKPSGEATLAMAR